MSKIFLNNCEACDNKWETQYPPRKCPNCKTMRPYDPKLDSPIKFKVGHLNEDGRVQLRFIRKITEGVRNGA